MPQLIDGVVVSTRNQLVSNKNPSLQQVVPVLHPRPSVLNKMLPEAKSLLASLIQIHSSSPLLKHRSGDTLERVGWSLKSEEPDGFYGKVGSLCATFFKNECERQGAPVGPKVLELPTTEEETCRWPAEPETRCQRGNKLRSRSDVTR